ncbi:hypothetical protein [Chitinophaga vietnamensis]|uniref:hypothetical protein n=1 Tax=Chitinophaga vietnamensis TaxID=2593957 RepID=UPI0011783B8C|nr:hypothetical protein [Chitinophaga vietnamensis]
MANPKPKFGKPIDVNSATQLFTSYIRIRERSIEKISKALEGDDEAIRYYCGRPDKRLDPLTEDMAFYFDKQTLTSMLTKILEDKADGFVLFHGARPEWDAETGEDTSKIPKGRPTIMVFPFKCEEDQVPTLRESYSFYNLTDVGEEHPGTGGGIKLTRIPGPYQDLIPVPSKITDVHGIFG